MTMLKLLRRSNAYDDLRRQSARRLLLARSKRMVIMAATASALMSGCGAGTDTSQQAATAPATVPTANQVETITDRDAPRDLVEAHYDGFRDTTPESTLVPDRALGDVIQTTLTHGVTRVGMQVDYAELQPVRSVDGGDWLSVEMVTDEGARWRLSLYTTPNHPAGITEFYRGKDQLVRCAVKHSIDYADNVITVSISRRCAGNPHWLRLRVLAYATEGNLNLYSDDALSDGPVTGALIESPTLYRADAN